MSHQSWSSMCMYDTSHDQIRIKLKTHQTQSANQVLSFMDIPSHAPKIGTPTWSQKLKIRRAPPELERMGRPLQFSNPPTSDHLASSQELQPAVPANSSSQQPKPATPASSSTAHPASSFSQQLPAGSQLAPQPAGPAASQLAIWQAASYPSSQPGRHLAGSQLAQLPAWLSSKLLI